MRKAKIFKKCLVYTLIGALTLSNVTPALAYNHLDKVDYDSNKNSIAEVHEEVNVTEDGTSQATVYAELGKEFTITVPKSLTLSGQTKSGTYTVSVEGDIAGTDKINVIPDETFTLNSSGLDSITASINQDKTSWGYDEILTDSKVIGNGEINASELSAGRWNGTFNFNINLEEGTKSFITVIAKDKSGNDLNASSNEIIGTEKEVLLNGLVEAGFVNSADEVDALIDVHSDDFDGLAETTFDVSDIAKEGDTVVIVHYDEEKQMWEHIATETVSSEGTITSDFSSYSPIGFIIIDSAGNQTVHTEHIDEDNDSLCDICNLQGTIVYNYHQHIGNSTSGGSCYKANYHTHSPYGGYCYTYTNDGAGCKQGYHTGSFSSYGGSMGDIPLYRCTYCGCEDGYGNFCSHPGYKLTCGRSEGLQGYSLNCDKTEETIESQYTEFK